MLWNLNLVWQHWQNPLPGLPARFRRSAARLAARFAAAGDLHRQQQAAWRRDPLSHPDLQAMSQRALDDLPFDPGAFTED